jgi:hypothetical protein
VHFVVSDYVKSGKVFSPKILQSKIQRGQLQNTNDEEMTRETTTAHHHHHQTNNMEEVAASEIPDGFFLADPSGGPKQPSSTASDQAAQRDAQRQAVLEQAMTPDALARLRRVKVG